MIAKIHTHDVLDLVSLNIVQGYLTNRKQRTKVDSVFSFWEKIRSGVPQGYILGPLLFNIFMCDKFLILKATSFTGYTDNNTPFVVIDNTTNVIKTLLNWWISYKMVFRQPSKAKYRQICCK